MSLRTQTCLVPACDVCGKDIDHEEYGTPHFTDEADAARLLGECGAVFLDGLLYCGACRRVAHRFRPDPALGDTCRLCDDPADARVHTDDPPVPLVAGQLPLELPS